MATAQDGWAALVNLANALAGTLTVAQTNPANLQTTVTPATGATFVTSVLGTASVQESAMQRIMEEILLELKRHSLALQILCNETIEFDPTQDDQAA